jgi:hypothetical protein
MKAELSKSIIFLFLLTSYIFAQNSPGAVQKDNNASFTGNSGVKSKSVYEYRYSNSEEEVLADSGYKAYYFSYDNSGRLAQYVNYNVFYALTVKEMYQYNGDNITQTARYNSADEMIGTIDYRYNNSGKLKREIHTAYYNSIRPGVHFSILANVNENGMFSKLQDELEIEPKLESYTITVNVSDPDELNQYVVIGDELDPTSPRYSWSQVSISTQRGLLSYIGPNRKEHTYKSKNIAKVNYKYDKNGNLISRTIYNTAGDMIEKETNSYNGDNQKISHYKFNENGRITSMEIYSYDAIGRLSESSGLDPSGKLVSKLIFKYNETGNLEEKIWLGSGGEVRGRYKYTYNAINKITEETRFREENEIEGRTVYNYDANGNIIEIVKHGVDDKKSKLTKYVYEFW